MQEASPGVRDLLLDSVQAWRPLWRPLTLMLVLTALVPSHLLNFTLAPELAEGEFTPAGVVVSVVNWMLYVLYYAAASRMVADSDGNWSAAWLGALVRSPGLIGLQFVGLFVLIGAMFLVAMPFTMVGMALGLEGEAASNLPVLPGMLAILFIVGQLQATIPAMMVEGAGPYAALKRSWGLTRGHRTSVLFALLTLVAPTLLVTLTGFVLAGSDAMAIQSFWNHPLTIALSAGVTCLVTPLTAVLATRILLRLGTPEELVAVFD